MAAYPEAKGELKPSEAGSVLSGSRQDAVQLTLAGEVLPCQTHPQSSFALQLLWVSQGSVDLCSQTARVTAASVTFSGTPLFATELMLPGSCLPGRGEVQR